MSSEYVEVRALVSALAKKVAESNPELCAQAIGSALFGLQRLSSDSPEVSMNNFLLVLFAKATSVCRSILYS